jgi:hypothetical protein
MSRSPVRRMGTRRACRSALSAMGAVLALGAPAPALAAPQATDTFSGTCRGLEGRASWPEQPMTLVPVDMLLRARLSGGECSGTLNGREVQSLPASARASLRGPQSCGAGATSGRFTFELAGRRITGKMTYRRVGSRVTARWEGDRGGSAVVIVRAQVGLVAQDHPLATTPVVGPHISGQVSSEETLRRCAGEGISSMPILAERITTTPSLSG